jgi:DNA-binding PadR family transcriptional regulator
MASGLNTFSHVILALVGEGGAGAHDLAESQRRAGSPYWSTSRRNMYAEPKRLAALGYLTATRQPGRTHERTVYRLTDQGRDALRAWITEPTPFPRIQSEAAVRLVAGYLVSDQELLQSLRALHAQLDTIAAGLDEAEHYAATLPDRQRYLRLVHSLGRRLVDTHRQWLKEVEHELDQAGAKAQHRRWRGAHRRKS